MLLVRRNLWSSTGLDKSWREAQAFEVDLSALTMLVLVVSKHIDLNSLLYRCRMPGRAGLPEQLRRKHDLPELDTVKE